jgi:hypothetical protein
MTPNALNSNTLEAFKVPTKVYNAIQKASKATGVNFTYMLEKAAVESGFDTNAKAKSSSATGLYQFIDKTWLHMVEKHGDKYGLQKYADKIDAKGNVSDSKTKKEILELRKDPQIASYMAAEFAAGNYNQLKQNVGGDIGATELYMAHFLGAGGASGFLNAMKKSPNMIGADLFPREARANRNVFYDRETGQPRTLTQIHAYFERKFESSPQAAAATQFASKQAEKDTVLRTAAKPVQQAHAKIAANEDPFARLSNVMSVMGLESSSPSASMLRIAGTNSQRNDAGWQIFPSNLYNKLALSPAQMMMLIDFNA